jgi:AcrR family transcriptional regulator
MGRPREHDESTKEALLVAAEKQLRRGEPLSVRSVAEAVGTTTRAVYSLFGSMDGLHQALLLRGFEDLRARIVALPQTDDPGTDLVEAGIHAFRAFAIEHPNLFRLGFEQMVPSVALTPEQDAERSQAIRALHAIVLRCRDAGLIGKREAREVTWQCHAFCQGLAAVELQGWFPKGDDPVRMWRDALGAFVAGLRSPPPVPPAVDEPRRTPIRYNVKQAKKR